MIVAIMGADTFICGECQTTFPDINAFLKHKNTNCQNEQRVMFCKVDATEDEMPVEQQEVEQMTEDGSQTVLQLVNDSGEHQTVSLMFCCLLLSCENVELNHAFNKTLFSFLSTNRFK